jgi:hypothetical protein
MFIWVARCRLQAWQSWAADRRLAVPVLFPPVQAGKLADKFAVVGVDQV